MFWECEKLFTINHLLEVRVTDHLPVELLSLSIVFLTQRNGKTDSMFRTSNTVAPDERCIHGRVLLGPSHTLMSGYQFLLPGFYFPKGCHRVESTRLLIFNYEYALGYMVMFHFHDSYFSLPPVAESWWHWNYVTKFKANDTHCVIN